MLIKALCDYSALQENKTPAGYCKQAIHFEILLTPEGKIAAINDLRVPRIIPLKNKKTKTVYDPVMEQLPVRTQKPGIDKNTIEHRPLYIFGLNYDKGTLTPTDATNKAVKSHKCFCEWNEKFFENIDSPICKAYLNFIRTWEPEQESFTTTANSKLPMRITSPSLTPTATVTIPNYPPAPFLVRSSRKPVSMIK